MNVNYRRCGWNIAQSGSIPRSTRACYYSFLPYCNFRKVLDAGPMRVSFVLQIVNKLLVGVSASAFRFSEPCDDVLYACKNPLTSTTVLSISSWAFTHLCAASFIRSPYDIKDQMISRNCKEAADNKARSALIADGATLRSTANI